MPQRPVMNPQDIAPARPQPQPQPFTGSPPGTADPGALAQAGRGGDTTVGHLTPNEQIIPASVFEANPALEAILARAFERAGMDPGRYRVGGSDDSINPETGMREFYDGGGGYEGMDAGGGFGSGGRGGAEGGQGGGGRAGGVGTPGVGGGFAPGDFDPQFGGGGGVNFDVPVLVDVQQPAPPIETFINVPRSPYDTLTDIPSGPADPRGYGQKIGDRIRENPIRSAVNVLADVLTSGPLAPVAIGAKAAALGSDKLASMMGFDESVVGTALGPRAGTLKTEVDQFGAPLGVPQGRGGLPEGGEGGALARALLTPPMTTTPQQTATTQEQEQQDLIDALMGRPGYTRAGQGRIYQ